MLRRAFKFIISLCLPLFLSGCFVLNLFDFGPDVDLGKHQWRIESFTLTGETYKATNFEQIPLMRFDTQEMKVYGNTGCNAFFANYVWLTDKSIEMRNSGMTRRMCASPESMKFEQKLMEEFDGEFEVVEEKEKLILKKEGLLINLLPYDPSQTTQTSNDLDSKNASTQAK